MLFCTERDYNGKAISRPKTKYTLPSIFNVKYWPRQQDLLRITHKTFKVPLLFFFCLTLGRALYAKNSNLAKKRFVRWVWDGQLMMCRICCGLSQTWAFSHAFLTEIQTELHTNKCAMRFESSSVKWLQNPPFVPALVWKWRELRWQVNGCAACDWARRVPSPDVQSRIVLVKEFVCSLTELSELSYSHTSRCEAHFKNSSYLSKVNVIFCWTRLSPFFH